MAEFWRDFNRKKKKINYGTEIRNKDHKSFDGFSEGGILAVLLSLWHFKIIKK